MDQYNDLDRNQRLAEIAAAETMKFYHGNMPGALSTLQPIVESFPVSESWTLDSWDNVWCGAFVYHCVILSGTRLPVRYPDVRITCNFAGVIAWMQWAQLPEVNKWIDVSRVPRIGDIVLLQQFCNIGYPDHMGIITAVDSEWIEIAEGNFNNMTAIIKHNYNNVFGYIRL